MQITAVQQKINFMLFDVFSPNIVRGMIYEVLGERHAATRNTITRHPPLFEEGKTSF